MKWHATCVSLRLEKENRARRLETAVRGRLDGIGCQHLQGMSPLLLQRHRKWLEDRMKDVWQGSDRRHTTHTASMEIKGASDVARPKHIANILVGQDAHGWITGVLRREMVKASDRPKTLRARFRIVSAMATAKRQRFGSDWQNTFHGMWKEARVYPDEKSWWKLANLTVFCEQITTG